MKRFLEWMDPYQQSFLYFKWSAGSAIVLVAAGWWLCGHAYDRWMDMLLNNMFIYLPNYLTHEFSHRIWCVFGWQWWCYASGNGMETLIVAALCLLVLQMRGGRYLLPVLLYWLATTLYGAGIYAADARAMKLPLTSSDMLSNFVPGSVKGDWWYILQPLGLLNYDVVIGKVLVYAGVCCLVLAVFSLWYYWTHPEQYIAQGRWN